jgi:hypothetical protein
MRWSPVRSECPPPPRCGRWWTDFQYAGCIPVSKGKQQYKCSVYASRDHNAPFLGIILSYFSTFVNPMPTHFDTTTPQQQLPHCLFYTKTVVWLVQIVFLCGGMLVHYALMCAVYNATGIPCARISFVSGLGVAKSSGFMPIGSMAYRVSRSIRLCQR